MAQTKEEAVFNIFGEDADGWRVGEIESFLESGYGKDNGRGVCILPSHGTFKFRTVYPIISLGYENAKPGDKVKVRTDRIQVDPDYTDNCVASIKVTEVEGNTVKGGYLTSQYDSLYLGEKLVEDFRDTEVEWNLDVEPEETIQVGQILHTALRSEIQLLSRGASHDGDSSNSEGV